jgi:NCS1 family nucleobase:cation symporter-1
VPLPESRRTWGKLSFVGYWLTIGLNITGWTAGSALLSLGLTVPQALGAAIIGNILIALAVVATGMLGAKWHVGFPMWNRIVWGMWGSYFPLVNRIILSFTWASSTFFVTPSFEHC